MMDEKVLSSKQIPLIKVKEMLKELAKEGELTYEQTLTLKYADKFSKIPRTKVDKLIEELMKIDGITDDLAIKIADLLPQNEEILGLIIGKNAKISNDELTKIVKLVKSFYIPEDEKSSKKKK
ncbi:MAG: DNA-directed RNA polymerase subunit F [Candidatus Diapherotrites archaeon CG10_big_fil_rev_8_21_14_0_10_31_34]|nr:MAG: DNA-directed RNA polymerase subunit F [Candidatus Diapherotrites archaeon CG10_big_fil_rev_8_21_14_0_10_31_34]PJA20870.1 MAG: DNA-directed RNA polymerase subunit F [Candidatus Diapherotrites archaeon CG_4_10_14_0_2_um_filter_31_5]